MTNKQAHDHRNSPYNGCKDTDANVLNLGSTFFLWFQVWCVQEEEQQYLNWTVDSGTHTLEVRPLQPGRVYWLRVAAVNGAGVGAQTNPYKLLIGTVYTLQSSHLSGCICIHLVLYNKFGSKV